MKKVKEEVRGRKDKKGLMVIGGSMEGGDTFCISKEHYSQFLLVCPLNSISFNYMLYLWLKINVFICV